MTVRGSGSFVGLYDAEAGCGMTIELPLIG